MSPGPTNLRAANLNLIPILSALLREANVSRAATSLGLSQSATSGALARLRLMLGDPILVQVGRSMRLTPKAQELLPRLEQLVALLGDLLNSAPFNPADADRRFVIATPDYIGFLIGNALIRGLQDVAPKVTAYFIDVPARLPELLSSGDVDLAIVDIKRPAWVGLSSQALFSDHLVWLVNHTHPLASRPQPTFEDVRAYPNLNWQSQPGRPSTHGLLADNAGHRQFLAQQYTVLPLLALDSDCVATVPKMLGDRIAELLPLATIEMPESQRTIHGGLLWSPVHEADPAHRWFRALLGPILAGYALEPSAVAKGRKQT